MKFNYATIIILSLILFVSCKKESSTSNENSTIKDSTNLAKEIKTDGFETSNENTKGSLEYFITNLNNLKNSTVEKLNTNPSDVNNIYSQYRIAREKEISKTNDLESKTLEEYVNFYNVEKNNYVFPDSIKVKIKLLHQADLEFWEIGEGYTEIRSKPSHYYNLFKGKVTEDYDVFLKNESIEEQVLYSADAGLTIPFKAIGKRILTWEKFIKKYPKSKLINEATELYNSYVTDYLFGLDNTPTMENGVLYDENKLELENFIKNNPNSKTSALISSFLNDIKNGENQDELRKIVFKKLNINLDESEN
jgi:hypothetical protein